MITLKLSDEQAQKLGITTMEEAISLLESANTNKAKLSETETELSAYAEKFSAIETRLKAVEGRSVTISAEDKAAIITEAKSEAAVKVVEALAKFGGKSIGGSEKTDESSEGKNEPAADDYEGQWKANHQGCADQFTSKDAFIAYKKAVASGSVKIFQNKS